MAAFPLLVAALLVLAGGTGAAEPAADPGRTAPVLALHTGAGGFTRPSWSPEEERRRRLAMAEALEVGWQSLRDGGSALDAVEVTIRALEDDPLFNAGRGATLNVEGRAQLDASIMDGWDQRAGAVAAVTRIRHPISAARAVMERTPHVLLVGPDADRWAAAHGLAMVNPLFFVTEDRLRPRIEALPEDPGDAPGTVGAVALDGRGHLAAGTSTGGQGGKLAGRVGDSPIVGAGTWADRDCAVSATGDGEYFIRFAIAHDVCSGATDRNEPPEAAAKRLLARLRDMDAFGGVILLEASGDFRAVFNTAAMPHALIQEDGPILTWLYEGDEPVEIAAPAE